METPLERNASTPRAPLETALDRPGRRVCPAARGRSDSQQHDPDARRGVCRAAVGNCPTFGTCANWSGRGIPFGSRSKGPHRPFSPVTSRESDRQFSGHGCRDPILVAAWIARCGSQRHRLVPFCAPPPRGIRSAAGRGHGRQPDQPMEKPSALCPRSRVWSTRAADRVEDLRARSVAGWPAGPGRIRRSSARRNSSGPA